MKTMTCKQLGGSCNKQFSACTFEEIAELSKAQGKEMFHKSEETHLAAMNEMQELMKSPEAMTQWFENKKNEFNSLPNDK